MSTLWLNIATAYDRHQHYRGLVIDNGIPSSVVAGSSAGQLRSSLYFADLFSTDAGRPRWTPVLHGGPTWQVAPRKSPESLMAVPPVRSVLRGALVFLLAWVPHVNLKMTSRQYT